MTREPKLERTEKLKVFASHGDDFRLMLFADRSSSSHQTFGVASLDCYIVVALSFVYIYNLIVWFFQHTLKLRASM